MEGRYAHALYSAAFKTKSLEKVEEELNVVRDTLLPQAKFVQFISDPAISRTAKREQLMNIARDLKLSDTTTNFLG